MRPERFHAEDIARFLKQHKIATLAQLKKALGSEVDSTVFRKLAELSHHTSYSHRGRFYTLKELARFDALGLWSFRSVWFSNHGTLLSTVEALVGMSDGGYFASELEPVLHVEVKVPLLKLVRDRRIVRHKLVGRYLYVSGETDRARQQVAARRIREAEPARVGYGASLKVVPDELKAAIVLFFSLLDEKQRRLYAGLEALKAGHGGDREIADLLGLNPGTVAKGRVELLSRDVEVDRVRRTGAGRKEVEKKRRKSSPRSRKS